MNKILILLVLQNGSCKYEDISQNSNKFEDDQFDWIRKEVEYKTNNTFDTFEPIKYANGPMGNSHGNTYLEEVNEQLRSMIDDMDPLELKINYGIWCVMGSLLFYFFSGVVLHFCLKLESWDETKFAEYSHKYSFSWSKFLFWYIMVIMGPLFVNMVTLQDIRGNLLLDAHMSFQSYLITIFIVAPVMYQFSSSACLKGPKEGLSQYGVFRHNIFLWSSAYMLGLNFTHFDVSNLRKFDLDWAEMQHWPNSLWYLFVLLIVFMAIVFTTSLYKGFLQGKQFIFYILWTTFLIGFFYYMHQGAISTHIHHYVVAAIILTFIGFQSSLLSVLHGLCTGIMIEGSTRWGYDPIWIYEWDTSRRIIFDIGDQKALQVKLLSNQIQSYQYKDLHEPNDETHISIVLCLSVVVLLSICTFFRKEDLQ